MGSTTVRAARRRITARRDRRGLFARPGADGLRCVLAAWLLLCLPGAGADASDFASATPTRRVEYWQTREAEVSASVADPERLRRVKVLFVGDSITDFWMLDGLPWAKSQVCGRRIWNETFTRPDSENFALNIGISGDRTEHTLFRVLPRSRGGAGIIDAPELNPEFIVLMIGINNVSDPEPVADGMYAGIRAVVGTLHEAKPHARIVLQSLLPIPDTVKDRGVVRPVNRRLAELASSAPFADYVSFLDLYPAFVDRSGREIAAYFNDGTHPNETGYRVWRERLLPFLERLRSGSKAGAASAGPVRSRSTADSR